MDSEEIDPIAKKIRDAAIHNREGTEAAAGERLLTADFARFARDLGPTELGRQIRGKSGTTTASSNSVESSTQREAGKVRPTPAPSSGRQKRFANLLDGRHHA